jgi:hypothetical protein
MARGFRRSRLDSLACKITQDWIQESLMPILSAHRMCDSASDAF